MELIKKRVVTIKYKYKYAWDVKFIDYTLKDGRHVYVADGELTTQEQGNIIFLNAKERDEVDVIKARTNFVSLDNEIKCWELAIDPYAEYIDNFEIRKATMANNARLTKIIWALKGE